MNIYHLPKIKMGKVFKNRAFWLAILIVFLSSLFGFLAGLASGSIFYLQVKDQLASFQIPKTETEEAEEILLQPDSRLQATHEEVLIKAVENIWPATVSIVISKDMSVASEYFFEEFEWFFGDQFRIEIPQDGGQGTERQEIGGGTGFIVSEGGLVLTNKHVVFEQDADYTVVANDGKSYSAKVLARSPLHDIAVLKIEDKEGKEFPVVKLGDSDNLRLGQIVIAIGNALGEFSNTVSVGVVSGLGRTITASGGGIVETLEDIIQTDAAINMGNSGGPLLNLKGEVVGINTAMAVDAQSIGFAIPINQVKKSIEQVKTLGKIVYPFLGIRYVLVDERIKQENGLPVNYGAWLKRGSQGEPAVESGSAAQKAGLREDDIILEFNGERVDTGNSLAKIIMKYNPGDKVVLKVLRNGQERDIEVVLGERS